MVSSQKAIKGSDFISFKMSNGNSVWNFPCGFEAPRGQVIFFVQVTAALIVILTAIVNLSVPNLCTLVEERNFWKIPYFLENNPGGYSISTSLTPGVIFKGEVILFQPISGGKK